jgi:hypothetical protein
MYKHLLDIAVTLLGYNARYSVLHKTYLGGVLVCPTYLDYSHKTQPTIIVWSGLPNHAMQPINIRASIIHFLFLKVSGYRVITPVYRAPRIHKPNPVWQKMFYKKKVV